MKLTRRVLFGALLAAPFVKRAPSGTAGPMRRRYNEGMAGLYARGGIVGGKTIALLGNDRGPETVIPTYSFAGISRRRVKGPIPSTYGEIRGGMVINYYARS